MSELHLLLPEERRLFFAEAEALKEKIPEDKKLPPRISRHLYDFFQLLNSSIKNKALLDTDLLDRVAKHKSIYFASAWANYGTAKKGTLRLSPLSRVLQELKDDYAAMESMFFGGSLAKFRTGS